MVKKSAEIEKKKMERKQKRGGFVINLIILFLFQYSMGKKQHITQALPCETRAEVVLEEVVLIDIFLTLFFFFLTFL